MEDFSFESIEAQEAHFELTQAAQKRVINMDRPTITAAGTPFISGQSPYYCHVCGRNPCYCAGVGL